MALLLYHRQEGTGGGTLSDAQTVEHNVLGPGSIGHILRHRTINPTTYAATDKWFGYDQVGSVLHETDDSGALATRHHQDAWGNVMQSYATGLWNGGASGWHHNTKETDADAGLVYMHQRWYGAMSGAFASTAPFDPEFESRYGALDADPLSHIDPTGMVPFCSTQYFDGGYTECCCPPFGIMDCQCHTVYIPNQIPPNQDLEDLGCLLGGGWLGSKFFRPAGTAVGPSLSNGRRACDTAQVAAAAIENYYDQMEAVGGAGMVIR